MSVIHCLACLWAVFVTQTGCVYGDIQFLERYEGESVAFPCVIETNPKPYGLYLKRTWLRPGKVLFQHTGSEFHVDNDEDKSRISVEGDPVNHALNVTVSHLRVSDTDRYHCEFMVEDPMREDIHLEGKTEFFLLVTADFSRSVDTELVEVCAGGSAVLPCFPPNGNSVVVDGVSLKRQRGRAPVEVLYHSKHHHGNSPPSSPYKFSEENVKLFSAPGPDGITYKLTVQQLQSEDSGLYSCQLLLQGRPENNTGLGRHVSFLSVQGSQCGCFSYSILLYSLSAAVAFLLLLGLLGFMMVYKGKPRSSVEKFSVPPIYEEMTRAPGACRKLHSGHLEEMESSVYRNCPSKDSSSENPYETPSGALYPRKHSHK